MSGTGIDARVLDELQHKAGEWRAGYVAEGRRCRGLANDLLEGEWARAFVSVGLRGTETSVHDLYDLSAEIGLRGRPLPAHLVQRVLSDGRMGDAGEEPPSLIERFAQRVRDFMRDQAAARRNS